MPITRLLAVINGEPESTAVANMAVALGADHPCVIDGLHVHSDRELVSWAGGPLYAGPMPAEVIAQLKRQQDERREAAQGIFTKATEGLPVTSSTSLPDAKKTSARWLDLRGDPWRIISSKGRTHDLTLVPRPTEEHWDSELRIVEAALFDSGRAVLVVPQKETTSSRKHIAVAWVDTSEAARSIWAAEPFLRDAERVSLIVVSKGDVDQAALDDVNEYFQHKEIDFEIIHQSHNGKPTAEQILDCVTEVEAGLLVMGAYGHSRLREMVLGGVTRGVLRAATVPVLMAH